MSETTKPVYEASMSRLRWRALYIKLEITQPKHRAAERWLSTAAAELFEVAEIKIKDGGDLRAADFKAGKAEDVVKLELSRDAVLGIKFAVIGALNGTGTPQRGPTPLLERRELLASVGSIGPDNGLRKLVEKESMLPEDEDIDEGSDLKGLEKK